MSDRFRARSIALALAAATCLVAVAGCGASEPATLDDVLGICRVSKVIKGPEIPEGKTIHIDIQPDSLGLVGTCGNVGIAPIEVVDGHLMAQDLPYSTMSCPTDLMAPQDWAEELLRGEPQITNWDADSFVLKTADRAAEFTLDPDFQLGG